MTDGGIRALVIATRVDPLPVLEALYPYLAPSGTIVVYSPYKEVRYLHPSKPCSRPPHFSRLTHFCQPITRCHWRLQSTDSAVQVMMNESWMREYQVLPKRTHPMMSMSGGGGCLLTGYKVRSPFGEGKLAAFQESSMAAVEDEEEAQEAAVGDEGGEGEERRPKKKFRGNRR